MYIPKVKSNQASQGIAKVLKGKVTIVISGLEFMCKFPLIVQTSFLVQWEEHDEEDGHDLLDVQKVKWMSCHCVKATSLGPFSIRSILLP